jgi:hypothetical protein
MGRLIQLVLSNFTLTFLIVGLIASAIALAGAAKPLTAPVVVEALFAYFILFSIGFSFFYNFVMHTFFGGMRRVSSDGPTVLSKPRSVSRASALPSSGSSPFAAASISVLQLRSARLCFCSAPPPAISTT